MKRNVFIILLLVFAIAIAGCTSAGNTIDEPDNQTEVATEAADTAEESESTEDTASEVVGAVHLTDENYHDVIDNTEGVAIVDFWADWCGPCQVLGPILDEINQEEGVPLYKVDVDENPKLAAEFKITGIPMVYIYKDGEVVDSVMGLGDKDYYINLVAKYE